MVYTSAKGIYGPVLGEYGPPTYKPMPEDMPKYPQRIYDSAKLMGEQTALYYAKEMGLDTAVLRFSTTYGPGKTARHGKMGVTSQIVENPFRGQPFHHPAAAMPRMISSTTRTRRSGFISPRSPKEFRAGSTTSAVAWAYPQRFCRSAAQETSGADIQIGPGLNFLGMPYPPHGVYDIARAREELGFKPRIRSGSWIGDYLMRSSAS